MKASHHPQTQDAKSSGLRSNVGLPSWYHTDSHLGLAVRLTFKGPEVANAVMYVASDSDKLEV